MYKLLISAVLTLLILEACTPKLPPPNGPVQVNILAVASKTVKYYDNYPANIVAINQVDLRPEVQGYISSISFVEGTHVSKGQELYRIDQRLYQQAYDQAKANLDVAKGNVNQAQQDADRYTYLNSYDAVAKQTLDHAIIALQNAKNTVVAAEQALKMAATNLTYSVISAPFDGTIGFSQVKLGNMVTIGQTVLTTVSSDDPIGVEFLISEKQLGYFEALKNTHQQEIDSLFSIVLPNDSIYPHLGKLTIIDRFVDPQSGSVRVRIEFPNPEFKLKPGMSCVLRVHNLERTPKITIPSKAVIELMGEYFVFLAKDTLVKNTDDSTKTHHALMAIQKKVQLGQTIAPEVIIKKGLAIGTNIVVDGVQSLHTGSFIQLSSKMGGEKVTVKKEK